MNARDSYHYALIDKTPIFYAFDISTTCQYFKVLLFIVDTIDIYIYIYKGRECEREKKDKFFFFFGKAILLISDTSRVIKNDGSITFTSDETEAFINHKISYRPESAKALLEKTGNRIRPRGDDPEIFNGICSRWPFRAANTKQMSTKFISGGVRMLLGAAINSQTPRGPLGIVETDPLMSLANKYY